MVVLLTQCLASSLSVCLCSHLVESRRDKNLPLPLFLEQFRRTIFLEDRGGMDFATALLKVLVILLSVWPFGVLHVCRPFM
jgi:hypothetical protein